MTVLESPAIFTLAVEIAVKSLIVLVAVLTVTWFMRRSSAAARHLYLSVAVVALLLLPIASIVLPSWNMGTVPNPFVSVEEKAESGPAEAAVPPAGTASPSGTDAATGTVPPAGTASSTAGRADLPDAAAVSMSRRTAAPTWIIYVWAIGGSILLLRLIGGKLYGNWIAGRAPAVEDERILAAVWRVAQRFGIKQQLPVVESDHLKVPFVSGLFRPRLVVPSLARRWSSERIEAILHHEFAHIKRRDVLVQFLAQIACCIYWINPLTWIMERRLFIERERACDDFAITENIKASDYAEYLMEVMEELGTTRSHVWVMSAMAEGTDFKDRILSVLDPIAARTSPRLTHILSVAALALLLLLPLSALNPWAEAGAISDEAVKPQASGQVRTGAVQADGADSRTTGVDRKERRRDSDGSPKRRTEALTTLLLDSPDPAERRHAATALGDFGDAEALQALIEALRDRDDSVREHVATALGQIGDKRAVAPLSDLLRSDRSARVREHAASALGTIGSASAYGELVDAFENDGDVRVRAHAAYGLGLLGDERALDLLINGLESEHSVIRAHCIAALGLIGGSRAERQVERALRDPSQEVRDSAARALQELHK
jgi:beta-lactamase regulating signal transducer with metallopeptidase domain